MSEQPLEPFDARLVDLLTRYGDRAVDSFEPSVIARGAVLARRQHGARIGLLISRRARLVLFAAVLVLLALGAALLAGVHRPSPIGDVFASPREIAWSPNGATLAFVVEVADSGSFGAAPSVVGTSDRPVPPARVWHDELWVVAGDGGEPRKLMALGSMATPQGLAWTPDSRSLVLGLAPTGATGGMGEIVQLGLDGAPARTLLSTGDRTPDLDGISPVADHLVYDLARTQGADLYILDLRSGASTRITTSQGASFDSWSTDGRWILYDDVAGGSQGNPASIAWVVSADGSTRHELGPCCGVGWSADASRVFFVDQGGALYSEAVDGSAPPADASGWAGISWTAASPGVFMAGTGMGVATFRQGETARIVPGTVGDGVGDAPLAMSPDGSWLAFSGGRNRILGTYLIPSAGGTPLRVGPDTSGGAFQWRPGGDPEFTFVSDRAILSVRADGTAAREIVTRTAIAGDPLGGADSADTSRIIIGPSGPDRDTYRVTGMTWPAVTIENRSTVPWVPWGITEKNPECQLVSGLGGSDPCTVEPGSAVRFMTEGPQFPGVNLEVWLGPAGSDPKTAIPVLVDFEATP
jgi:hypothetical protein